jgi:putative addiction module killer protein
MFEIRQTKEYAKWFKSVRDHNARGRIDIRIRRLSLGNPGDVRPVGDSISELRIDYGPGYRVYYIQHGFDFILLLIGGDKSTQRKDIAKAKELLKEL